MFVSMFRCLMLMMDGLLWKMKLGIMGNGLSEERITGLQVGSCVCRAFRKGDSSNVPKRHLLPLI